MQFLRRLTVAVLALIVGMNLGCGGKEPDKVALKSNTLASPVAGPDFVSAADLVDPDIQKSIKAFGEELKRVAANKAAEGGVDANDMLAISRALRIYEDVGQHLPALNGTGKSGWPHPGLSWRVMLLPYLGATPLYRKFDLDQPWDSPQNKPLIAEMPAVFGTDPEGKTRVHVLNGDGAPFMAGDGLKLDEISDGVADTLACVIAGPDQAAIWTAPGGLEFDRQNPLKCLGNIGDNFLAAFLDQSVCRIPKSIDPDQFADLVQYADGHKIRERPGRLDVREVDDLPLPQIVAPATPLTPIPAKIDYRFIPQDAYAAIVLHPRRVLFHPVIQGIREQFPSVNADEFVRQLPEPMRAPFNRFKDRFEWIGMAPQYLDEFILLFDSQGSDSVLQGSSDDMPPHGVILRHGAPIQVDAAVRYLKQEFAALELEEFKGVAVLVEPKQKWSIAFPNNTQLLYGSGDFVQKMINAKGNAAPNSGLTHTLENVGNRLLMLAVDGMAIERQVTQAQAAVPPAFSPFSPFFKGAKSMTFSLDFDAPEFCQLQLKFKQAELATSLHETLVPQWNGIQGQLKSSNAPLPFLKPDSVFQSYATQCIRDARLTQDGEAVTLTIPKVADFDKLPERLKPAIDAAKQVADESQRKAHLKSIGLAFHNYHGSTLCLPALNGHGSKLVPAPGLSWRVYLLPYVDEYQLYSKFKLDEPWDSAHNKPLITQMPKIYGTNQDGKSSIHVFTGQGAPFRNDVGTALREVTDGLTTTILAVETGADTATIWSKPGGLEFDPVNPLQALGEIKEFLAVMMDGSVRQFQNLDPQDLRKMIQYNDGESVELPR